MSKKNVLVVGSGAREDAVAWKFAQSPLIGDLYVAPGNGGTSRYANQVPLKALDFVALANFAESHQIDLTFVGPDDPLAQGIVDVFNSRKLPIFGPTRRAAKIESSKVFAKTLMVENGIPTASGEEFDEYPRARAHIHARKLPMVIKASGLALGKGVYLCRTLEEAEVALEDIMIKCVHGDAGNEVVIEDYLEGTEVSGHAIRAGTRVIDFPFSQDFKRIFDDDRGPNTGGMGAIVPVPGFGKGELGAFFNKILLPTFEALKKRRIEYNGILYPGLMKTADGLKVLEYNARGGDPEMQVYMRLMQTDLLKLLIDCVSKNPGKVPVRWHKSYAACVVLASQGYPGTPKIDVPIMGIADAEKVEGVVVYHAGTKLVGKQHMTSGGRVLSITAMGATLKEAIDRAYAGVGCIRFDGMQYRRDIGRMALEYASL
jgi:phosphoribosylamine--glycine ligase